MDEVTVLNTVTGSLPFPISAGEPGTEEAPREEMRLRHRILDLRHVAQNPLDDTFN